MKKEFIWMILLFLAGYILITFGKKDTKCFYYKYGEESSEGTEVFDTVKSLLNHTNTLGLEPDSIQIRKCQCN